MYYGPPPQRPHRTGFSGPMVTLIAGVFSVFGLLIGCGVGFALGTSSGPLPAPSSTAAAATSAAASPTPTTRSTSPSGSPSTASASPSASPTPPRKIKVPDVVGMNHQAAQDLMQSRGLYMLQEEDATGQGRMLLLDRNWVVVRQSPKAGTRVTEDRTITLYSKKIGE